MDHLFQSEEAPMSLVAVIDEEARRRMDEMSAAREVAQQEFGGGEFSDGEIVRRREALIEQHKELGAMAITIAVDEVLNP